MRIRKHPYLLETIWMDKYKFDEAERLFHEGQQAFAASAVVQAAQGAELAPSTWVVATEDSRQEQEAGMMQRRKQSQRAWPEEVERSRQLEMTGLPMIPSPEPVKDTVTTTKAIGRDAKLSREARPLVAWHQLVHGVWLNKSTFDEAERLFILRSRVCDIPRSLPIPTSGVTTAPKLWATPDEGYISATPATPITPGFPTGRDPSSLVNGMFPNASHFPLALQVWLEKPLYDDAERLYHEKLYGSPALVKEGYPQPKSQRPAAPSLASAHRNGSRCLLSPVNEDSLAAAQHLVHEDSELVWFNKPIYDAAELRYHLAQMRRAADQPQKLEPSQAPLVERAAPAPPCLRLHDKNMAVNFLAEEKIWFDKYKYDDAEMQYYIKLNGPVSNKVQNSPAKQSTVQCSDIEMCARVISLEKENQSLHQGLRQALKECGTGRVYSTTKPEVKKNEDDDDDDQDDIDLFGSSDDDDEKAEKDRVREERLRQYAEKKSKKPAVIAKSSILLDVKPIQCVVEDDKVGTDLLEEEITKFEDYVQSVDIAAFNKI
ncbi:hypothetical protein chiPu_0018609 [Chiloscyllium punctatum]|uniref:Elongation factor 1-delta n=1 Tax=Chiloscyllium punctatum TaxID=137246 RepID=A0A401RP76_CHIPU|nr:hypothetical protein [Chiloscyllium punctatum]